MGKKEKGSVPILIMVAIVGILGFVAIANFAPFKDKLFSSLYPKPPSHAASISGPTTPTPTKSVSSPITLTPTPIICQVGLKTITYANDCGKGKSKAATYTCYDGLSGKLGDGKRCVTNTSLLDSAKTICQGRFSCL